VVKKIKNKKKVKEKNNKKTQKKQKKKKKKKNKKQKKTKDTYQQNKGVSNMVFGGRGEGVKGIGLGKKEGGGKF